MTLNYNQYFDILINHINKTVPTLVKDYDLEVYHSGGGCFILETTIDDKTIGITPIEKIIINGKEIEDISHDLTLIKDSSTKCLFTKNEIDGEFISSFELPLLEGLQKLKGAN